MHLPTRELGYVCIMATVLTSVYGAEVSPFNPFVASLEGDDSPSAEFWSRNERSIYPRAPGDDPQTSLTLDSSQVQEAYASDALNATYDGNLTPSLTSTNNFINWCLTQNITMTNGKQLSGGSCSPTPMGRVVARNKMPSCKFQFPKNGSLLPSNTAFVVKLAVRNLESGLYSNPDTSFYAAPQTVNEDGILRGHSHVVIEAVPSYMSEEPLDPASFTHFQSLKKRAVDGVISVNITGGLPPGIYRIGTITTAINHQPALVGVAQHGILDDVVYFQVSANDF